MAWSENARRAALEVRRNNRKAGGLLRVAGRTDVTRVDVAKAMRILRAGVKAGNPHKSIAEKNILVRRAVKYKFMTMPLKKKKRMFSFGKK